MPKDYLQPDLILLQCDIVYDVFMVLLCNIFRVLLCHYTAISFVLLCYYGSQIE